jgi:hypothetical protein
LIPAQTPAHCLKRDAVFRYGCRIAAALIAPQLPQVLAAL